MARASYKCSKCKRKFKMPAHLARHMNTIHASAASRAKSKAAAKGKRRVGRPRGPAAGRPVRTTAARSIMGGAASRLLSDMQVFQNDLLSQRNSLDSEIDSLARAMDALGGAGGSTRSMTKRKVGRPVGRPSGKGRPRGSAPREGSLKSFIVRVLKQNSKPLSPNDIGTRVVKAGFKTKAKDITKAVSNTLPQLGNVKRIGFGKYKMGR